MGLIHITCNKLQTQSINFQIVRVWSKSTSASKYESNHWTKLKSFAFLDKSVPNFNFIVMVKSVHEKKRYGIVLMHSNYFTLTLKCLVRTKVHELPTFRT